MTTMNPSQQSTLPYLPHLTNYNHHSHSMREYSKSGQKTCYRANPQTPGFQQYSGTGTKENYLPALPASFLHKAHDELLSDEQFSAELAELATISI